MMMKKILILLLSFSLAMPMAAQTNKKRTQTSTAQKRKTTAKKTKSAASQQKKTSSKATYSNASIRGLQNQRAKVQKEIKQQEQALRTNKADVKQRLQNLMVLNTEIEQRKKSIDTIQSDISTLDGNIEILKSQLTTLEQQLKERQQKYIKSMRYMSKHRSVQDKLMFIFSAKSLTQMYRRLRFVREYAAYQRGQGEALKAKQAQVNEKQKQLQTARGQKNNLLYKGKKEHAALQTQQGEQEKEVQSLQKQQKTIQSLIAQQRQKDAALNAQIDRLIAEEVAKAEARAKAEAKKRAAAAEAAKRRAAELARKKAAAEAEARENARRIQEAKEREERLKAEARAAAKAEEEARKARAAAEEKAKQEEAERKAAAATARRERAQQQAREAEAARLAAERKARVEKERNEKELAEAKKDAEEASSMTTADRMVSGGFEANKGRLPMPITGSYRIVSHFGQYNVEGLKGVTLDNKGINILGKAGCAARSVYDGEVSGTFSFGGTMVVMVRHGAYISVYCNLRSVNVARGQKVKARQVLGYVANDNVLQFQLRRGTAKLNPESWLSR